MSSMYKGVLTVVAATVVTSAMILMTGNSNADNKQLESSDQKTVSEGIGVNSVATKSVATKTKGKQPTVSPPPPPPGPFVYGAPDSAVSINNKKNKSRTVDGLHVKKPQAPALSSTLKIHKLNVPVKPILSTPKPAMKQEPVVVVPSDPKIPAMPQKKVAPQQHNNSLLKLVKPKQEAKTIVAPTIGKSIGSFKSETPSMGNITGMDKPVFAPPSRPKIKPFVPKLESVPVPNITKPQMPKFQMDKPAKPVNNVPVLEAPQPISNTVKQMPKPLQKREQGNKQQPPVMNSQKRAILQPNTAPVPRSMPSFGARAPEWQHENKGIVTQPMKKPDFTHPVPENPQNIVPSYQMTNPTMPAFYYYYPVPNWNNTMQDNWNTNNQMWPYYGYRLDPQINRNENPNINHTQGQQLPGQNMPSPAMMQKNINNSSVNGQN